MTQPSDRRRPPPPAYVPGAGIGDQSADYILNADRDAYLDQSYRQYVHTVVQQRRSFLRDVAATRTRARGLVGVGFTMFLVGFGAFAYGILRFLADGAQALEQVSSATTTYPDLTTFPDMTTFPDTSFPEMTTPFGPPVLGVPLGLLGWGLAALGVLVMIVGGVLHVVATAKRHRVDREHPEPSPVRPPWWDATSAWGGR